MDEAVGWLVAAGFTFFAFRYLFGASSSDGSGRRRSNVPQSSIDQVSSMFPHVPTHAIRYDLERNGANVQSTVERCLRDGTLPDPPAGFFPTPTTGGASEQVARPSSSSTTTTTTPTTSRVSQAAGAGSRSTPASSSSAVAQNVSPSLIQRMGLQDRVQGSSPASSSVATEVKGWQATPEAREKALREKKAKMVLQARQRLLEKQAKGKGKEVVADEHDA